MNRLVIELNRDYIKNEISNHIDRLFNEIKSLVSMNEILKKDVKDLENRKTELAIAYAKEIGVLITKKEYKKIYESDPLDEIFVDSHKKSKFVKKQDGEE